MRKPILFLSLLLSFLILKSQNPFPFPENIEIVEQPFYLLPELPTVKSGKALVLQMAYAQDEVMNMEDVQNPLWDQVHSIDLVFTKYPVDTNDWRTDYNVLMEGRLRSLYDLDSSIFYKKGIKWRYVLQTDCKNEPEAMQFFHGFIIKMEPGVPVEKEKVVELVEERLVPEKKKRPRLLEPSDSLPAFIKQHPEMEEIAAIMYGKVSKLKDSSVFKIINRHPEWKNMLVVMDWTASMYVNRATVMNWYRSQLDAEAIRHLIFFNDGNWTPHGGKKIGKTGGIYHTKPYDFDHILRLMYKVRKNGLGGDPAENDMEALLVSARNLNGYEEILLLPDRNTSIRDLRLLPKFKKPVRILLFRNKMYRKGRSKSGKLIENPYIHPHYLTLASFTGGSIHTDELDIYNLKQLKAGEILRFGDFQYQKQTNGSFKLISRG